MWRSNALVLCLQYKEFQIVLRLLSKRSYCNQFVTLSALLRPSLARREYRCALLKPNYNYKCLSNEDNDVSTGTSYHQTPVSHYVYVAGISGLSPLQHFRACTVPGH